MGGAAGRVEALLGEASLHWPSRAGSGSLEPPDTVCQFKCREKTGPAGPWIEPGEMLKLLGTALLGMELLSAWEGVWRTGREVGQRGRALREVAAAGPRGGSGQHGADVHAAWPCL